MSKRSKIIALILMGTVLLLFAMSPTADAHSLKAGVKITPLPEPQKTQVHRQAFDLCLADGRGRCNPIQFRHYYAHLAQDYWIREWAHRERDFDYALKKAAEYFGVSRSWLKACNRSEGGAGPWKWNGGKYLIHYPYKPAGSSGAGGPMQFMEGTYIGYANDPLVARILPSAYQGTRGWKKRAGQAFVAAYMFRTIGSGQWTGAGC